MGADRTPIRLGTATPGGGFEVYGQVLAETLNAMDPSLDVRARGTKGSAENVPLLEAGQLDMALVAGEVAHAALDGIGRPPAALRVLSVMYSSPGMFAVKFDSPYRRIEDLKGEPVVFGARGSGLVLLARYVLDGLGLDLDRDFQPILLDSVEEGPRMVAEGKAVALWGAGENWPGFRKLTSAPAGARFVVPDADGVRRILAKHTFLKQLTVPAGSYAGQSDPIASVGTWSVILVRSDLDEWIAYRLSRALHRGEAVLRQRLSQARETTAIDTLAAVRIDRLHRGVLRYFREAGLTP